MIEPQGRRSPATPPPAALPLVAALALAATACTSGMPDFPTPRRLVIHSGERITPDVERMKEVDAWLREQHDSITWDPSFMIVHGTQDAPAYPWQTLWLNESGDSADIRYQNRPGLMGPYRLYAHLHLMAVQGRLDRWLPEAVGGTPFEIETAILARVADSWLYQRSIFDIRPNGILDELVYASEFGFLDAFILTARPGAFVEARRVWQTENPGRRDEYVAWFRKTFERDPPGMRGLPQR